MNIATRLLTYTLLTACPFFSTLVWAQSAKTQAIPQVGNDWRYVVAPYLWLTNINGSVYYGGSEITSSSISAGSLLSHLNIGGMIELEAHKGDWGIFADIMYARLSNATSTPTGPHVSIGANTTINQGIYTVAATYTVAKSSNLYADVLLGARMVTLGSTTNFSINEGNSPLGLSATTNTILTDPVIGFKGRARMSNSDWFVPVYVDMGGGGSTVLTTQAFLGLGRSFDWGDAVLGVKNLYFQQKNQGVTTNMDLFGVALGVVFKF